jgi:hypothetical protein
MKFTENDFNEISRLASLIKMIDEINVSMVDKISDEIYVQQPFFLQVLLGYSLDLTQEEFEEVIKMYLLKWEYFKAYRKISKKITESDFMKTQMKYVEMLKYIDGETDQNEKKKVYAIDLQNHISKSLWTAIIFRFDTRPILFKMDTEKKGPVMIGIRSFIDCFENLR